MAVPANDIQELNLAPNHSMAADFYSADMEFKAFLYAGIQFIWTGADAIDAQVIPQVSLDRINWCDLASGTNIKKVDSPADCQIYSVGPVTATWLRIRFVANSNTAGTINILVMAKGWGFRHG